jgi:TnpA family transposase
MPRRRVLTSAQISELLALPTDEPTLIRHYTLSDADLAVIQRRRRPHNRLGFALQLCTLRYPGRLPRPGEFIPAEILNFLAVQLDRGFDNLASYGARRATRYEQLEPCAASSAIRPSPSRIMLRCRHGWRRSRSHDERSRCRPDSA